eukprot:m51a1_g10249 hypothetical protein (746) ;mRNA; r:50683-54195
MFGRYLVTNTIPEWRSRYLNYHHLKARHHRMSLGLRQAEEPLLPSKAPAPTPVPVSSAGDEERRLRREYGRNFDRVDQFYVERVAEDGAAVLAAASTLNLLGMGPPPPVELQVFGGPLGLPSVSVMSVSLASMAPPPEHSSRPEQIRRSLWRVFDELSRLERFCELNRQGFEELVEKVRQRPRGDYLADELQQNLESLSFYDRHRLKDLLRIIPTVYAEAFTSGNMFEAMVTLSQRPDGTSNWRLFLLGLFMGLAVLLLLVALIWWFHTPATHFVQNNEVFLLFRSLGLAILLVWMWGVDLYICIRTGLNYVFLFNFDPRKHKTNYLRLFEIAACLTVVWLLALVLYLFSCSPPKPTPFFGRVWPPLWPLILWCICIVLFVAYQISARLSFIRELVRIFLAPLFRMRFRDSFIADQLVSLSIIWQDIVFSICFYTSDAWSHECRCLHANAYLKSLVTIIPSFLRMVQCFRQHYDNAERWWVPTKVLGNAGKYSSSIVVSVLSALRSKTKYDALTWVWLVAVVINTVYNFSWDISQDWGLMKRGNTVRPLLRDVLVFRPPALYYCAMGLDLLLRLMWTLTISPGTILLVSKMRMDVLMTIIAAVEIFRRGMWNVFRIENEHVHQFKPATPVPTPASTPASTPAVTPDVTPAQSRRGSPCCLLGTTPAQSTRTSPCCLMGATPTQSTRVSPWVGPSAIAAAAVTAAAQAAAAAGAPPAVAPVAELEMEPLSLSDPQPLEQGEQKEGS